MRTLVVFIVFNSSAMVLSVDLHADDRFPLAYSTATQGSFFLDDARGLLAGSYNNDDDKPLKINIEMFAESNGGATADKNGLLIRSTTPVGGSSGCLEYTFFTTIPQIEIDLPEFLEDGKRFAVTNVFGTVFDGAEDKQTPTVAHELEFTLSGLTPGVGFFSFSGISTPDAGSKSDVAILEPTSPLPTSGSIFVDTFTGYASCLQSPLDEGAFNAIRFESTRISSVPEPRPILYAFVVAGICLLVRWRRS